MHAVEVVSSNYMLQTVFTSVKIVFVGFSAMSPCSVAGGHRRLCRTCCLRFYFRRVDGGSMFLTKRLVLVRHNPGPCDLNEAMWLSLNPGGALENAGYRERGSGSASQTTWLCLAPHEYF